MWQRESDGGRERKKERGDAQSSRRNTHAAPAPLGVSSRRTKGRLSSLPARERERREKDSPRARSRLIARTRSLIYIAMLATRFHDTSHLALSRDCFLLSARGREREESIVQLSTDKANVCALLLACLPVSAERKGAGHSPREKSVCVCLFMAWTRNN